MKQSQAGSGIGSAAGKGSFFALFRLVAYAVVFMAVVQVSGCSEMLSRYWPRQLTLNYWMNFESRVIRLLSSDQIDDRMAGHGLLRQHDAPVPEALPLVLEALDAESMEERSWAVASMGTAFKKESAHIPAVRAAVERLELEALEVDPMFGRQSWIDMMVAYRVSYLDRMIAIRDGLPTPQETQFLPGGSAYEVGAFRPAVEAEWPGWSVVDGVLVPPSHP